MGVQSTFPVYECELPASSLSPKLVHKEAKAAREPLSSVPRTFRAYQYEAFGAPESELRLREDVPTRPLEPSQVRIKVHSAALNPADQKIMQDFGLAVTGRQPSETQPFGVGFDVAGTVVETGARAGRFHVGDAVFAMASFSAFGTFAEFVVVDAHLVAPKPSALSFEQAASVPYAALTSYQALLKRAQLQRGECVLVLGAATATGIFAVQLARALGAEVLATVRGCDDVLFAQSLGATRAIDVGRHKWADEVEPHSVDVVYDCGVERKAWNRNAQLVLKRDSGRFVTINPMQQPRASKFGATCLGEVMVQPNGEHLRALGELLDAGAVAPVVDSVFAFERLLPAMHKLQTSKVRGKIVLRVQN